MDIGWIRILPLVWGKTRVCGIGYSGHIQIWILKKCSKVLTYFHSQGHKLLERVHIFYLDKIQETNDIYLWEHICSLERPAQGYQMGRVGPPQLKYCRDNGDDGSGQIETYVIHGLKIIFQSNWLWVGLGQSNKVVQMSTKNVESNFCL